MKHIITATIYIILGALLAWVVFLLLPGSKATGLLQKINTDYASILSAFASLVLLVITAVYVALTHAQAKSSKESVEISRKYLAHAEKQLRHSKVPMLVANIEKTKGGAYFGERRRQLNVDWKITNIGDGPAIQIHTRMKLRYAHAELKDYDELYEHSFIGNLAPSETGSAHMHFETTKIEKMLEDFEIRRAKNVARIRTNPHQSAYKGPQIELEVLYTNVYGQYFISLYSIPLLYLKVDSREGEFEKKVYWFAEKQLQDDEEFELAPMNPVFSTFDFHAVEESQGKEFIEHYRQLL